MVKKNGDLSIRTKKKHEAIKQELKKGNNVKVVIKQVIDNKTPKELSDEEIEKYKKEHNGIAPEWNKQKNHKKWKDNENKSS
ncbi:hypothetical protein [Campylobacter insulaenigrae]|uniref:hypothetical protein n=1 Tax=Campylobacter insulaenigrae TaxID=260714 RepID=UPI0021537CB6|nr:hypothetical protein [Campylobacter insulaenigrae]MCR6573641.1 hypothetical protein [Campylobacter insulaenigrae]MCR6579669.1 hypothetical protein [Campylobacter insulaenigrae]MCR6586357.1 hypothetical protein [Campylobacter insulaenigrae]